MSEQLTLDDARRERDATLHRIHQDADDQDRNAVRGVILHFASLGVPFSSNHVRPLLPALRSKNIVGPCFGALVREGRIRRVGYEPSTDPGTKGHPVARYVGVQQNEAA